MPESQFPRPRKMSWKAFIKQSLTRPKLGHWSDMCLAPVDTFLLVYCEASRAYSFYEGQAIGICLERPSKVTGKMEYDWYLVGKTDKDGIFNYTPCNPHWWMPLPLSPPERNKE